jgi:hypothetical protein
VYWPPPERVEPPGVVGRGASRTGITHHEQEPYGVACGDHCNVERSHSSARRRARNLGAGRSLPHNALSRTGDAEHASRPLFRSTQRAHQWSIWRRQPGRERSSERSCAARVRSLGDGHAARRPRTGWRCVEAFPEGVGRSAPRLDTPPSGARDSIASSAESLATERQLVFLEQRAGGHVESEHRGEPVRPVRTERWHRDKPTGNWPGTTRSTV